MDTHELSPSTIRRIVSATPEETEAAQLDLDLLLAWGFAGQWELIGRLPPSRERDIALQKLEECVCFTRLAILEHRAPKEERAGGAGGEI